MILGWYVLGQVVAWCSLPLAWSTCRHLRDRGYGVRHSIGLLVTGFFLWIGTSAGLLANDRQGAFVALLAALLLSVFAGRLTKAESRSRLIDWLSKNWRLLALQEVIFLGVFLGWCWVRMNDPAINHTEQSMDLMLLAGVLNSTTLPLQDPWLSGYAVSYYYFGYWLQAVLAQLTGSAPEIAYNLSQAWWLAMLSSSAFSVVFHLLAPTRDNQLVASQQDGKGGADREGRRAVIGGLLGAFLVAGAANLDGTLRAIRRLSGSVIDMEPWWWFRSSRVISDLGPGGSRTELITEFPAFSFVLGDNHPHVLFLPFLLLTVSVTLNLMMASASLNTTERASDPGGDRSKPGIWRRSFRGFFRLLATSTSGSPWTAWMLIALVAGSPLVINTWDLPLVWVLLAVPAWLMGRGSSPRSGFPAYFDGLVWVATAWVVLGASTLTLFFPYLLTAQSQARGWLPNLLNPTAPASLFLMFGAFLPASLALLLPRGRGAGAVWKRALALSAVIVAGAGLALAMGGVWATNSVRGREWLDPHLQGQSLLGLFADRWLARPLVLLGLALLLGFALAKLRSMGRQESAASISAPRGADGFVVLLLTLGFGVVMVPELVFVHDVFSARINTVFKFYYQAWVLVSLACAYAILRFRSGAGLRTLLTRVSLILLLASSVYLLAAVKSKHAEWGGEPTLDGLAYLGADERAAIEWIRHWTESRDVILQAVGSSYRAEHSRASAATGRATLLGWQGHEIQWRGAGYPDQAAGRGEAVEIIYRSGDAAAMANAMSRFSVDYVYVGPVERELYEMDEERHRLLDEMTQPVFSQGEVRILRVTGPTSPL